MHQRLSLYYYIYFCVLRFKMNAPLFKSSIYMQGMAYATLSGLPPVYGLFSAFIPPIVYPFLGSSMHLAVGPVALVSLSNRGVLKSLGLADPDSDPIRAVELSASVAFMVSCVLMVLGLLRLGNLTRLFSHAVLRGFTSAAAITIGMSQIDSLLGLTMPSLDYTYQEAQYLVQHLQSTNIPTMASDVTL